MPSHVHPVTAHTEAVAPDDNGRSPGGRRFAAAQAQSQGGNVVPVQAYGQPVALTAMAPAAVSSAGGSQPHTNMMPYLVLNFVIALRGIFPSQN